MIVYCSGEWLRGKKKGQGGDLLTFHKRVVLAEERSLEFIIHRLLEVTPRLFSPHQAVAFLVAYTRTDTQCVREKLSEHLLTGL